MAVLSLIPDPSDTSILGGLINRAAKHGCKDFTVHSYELVNKFGRRYELRAANYVEPLAVADVAYEHYLNVRPDTSTFVPDWQYSDLLCWL